MTNYRVNQQQSRVKKIISHLLQNDVKDPRIGFISITGVDLTKDLSECKVYFSVLNGEEKLEETKEALKSASGYLRKQVAAKANLRRTPALEFIYDDSLAYGAKIDRLLKEVENEKE
ncbi:MAG: 30S ribosome-binding factor RbfA [Clostridia bacterium]